MLGELTAESNHLFTFNDSTNRISTWQNLIKEQVKNDTGEDNTIEDEPASWGKTEFYRLLSGGDDENYFKIRAGFIKDELK